MSEPILEKPFRCRALFGTLLLSLVMMGVPASAPATHCKNYPAASPTQQLPPVLVIASGYFGVGGIGALDPYGCVAGREVADSRVLLPRADFVVLVLSRVKCTPGRTIKTGALTGLGLRKSYISMRCVQDIYDSTLRLPNHRAYVSGIYRIRGTGYISGSAILSKKTYVTRSRKIA